MKRKGLREIMNILKYKVALSLILAAVLFVPSFALADAVSGPISNVAYDQQNPHTIYLIDQGVADVYGNKFGLWLTVWEDWRNRATTGADIRGQFINADGSFCGSEFIITNSSGNQTVPRASYRQDVSDPTKSKVVVVWQDTRPNYVYLNALSNINAAAGCSFDADTERAIGFNPVRVYSYATQIVTNITDEFIGTMTACGFTVCNLNAFLANSPLVPGSVVVKVDGVVNATDNGTGKLTGTIEGTIDYRTGSISVGIPDPGATTVSVTVSYAYFHQTADVTNELIDYGNGSDTDFRGTLAIAPIVPGTLSINVGGVPTGTNDDGLGRLVPTLTTSAEPIATGDGISKTFTKTLSHFPVEKHTVVVKVAGVTKCNDSGNTSACTVTVNYDTGFVTALFKTATRPALGAPVTVDYKYYAGTVSYESGVVSLSFAAPPTGGDEISVDYTYRAVPPAKISRDDRLLARMQPRIAYDRTADRFWVVWKETRSILHEISEVCFAFTNPSITNWAFDDSDFIGYVRLGGNTLFEQNSALEVAGSDIIRNADTTTVREVSSSASALEEIREYESFKLANNPDVACDDTSTQCLVVSEGLRTKQTLTCTCDDKNSNSFCDLADVVTSKVVSASFDDGFVHIYGLADNYMTLPVYSSMKLDSGASFAHYPTVAFDSISNRFLTAWEDFRDGANTKIYGQLVLSGGGLYNDNFIISYQDSDATVLNSKQTKPFVSYDGVNQRFFVAWQDSRNSTLSLENLDLYGQKVDSEGSLRGNNYAILTQSSNQYNPTIAYNELTDTYLAAWKDARNSDNSICSTSGSSGGHQPCGSDVFGKIFTLGQPAITLFKMDDTTLTPPLLNDFQNPPATGSVAVGLFASQSFKVVNTGDTTLKIDDIFEDLDCNGTPSPLRDIAPFSFDGLPSELTAADAITLDLVPSASITLTVRFTPLRAGMYNKCFIIESNGGNRQVNISGYAIEPNITVTPSSGSFGSVYVGNSVDRSFMIKNTGFADLVISTIDAPSAPFTIQSDSCSGHSITSGSTCTIVARFSPSAVSPPTYTSAFVINSNDPDTAALSVSLSGTGLGAPAITVSPASIAFGNVQIGQISQKSITISNSGTSTLSVTAVTLSPSVSRFSIIGGTCAATPFSLAVGVSCNVTVQFAPNVSGGTSASITISSDDPAPGKSPMTIGLSGTGITTPALSADPSSVIFLNTLSGSTAQQLISVTNAGTANLIISSLTYPSGEFSVSSSNCLGTFIPKTDATCVGVAATLPPCQCTATVVFKPTSAGFKTSSFKLVSNDPVNPTTTIPVSGTAKIAPVISASPSPAEFGGQIVGTAWIAVITVKNTGNDKLVISSIGGPASPFGIWADTCTGATVVPLSTCQITLSFAPIAALFSSSSIIINSNDPATPALTVDVTGTGLEKPVIKVTSPPSTAAITSLAFGNQVVGATSAPKTVRITNNGLAGSVLKITSVVNPSTPFKVTANTCTAGLSLASGASCNIDVTFSPTALATYSPYYLTVNTNDPATPVSKITISGTGVKKPTISVSPTSLAFGNLAINTTSSKKTITVKNTASNSTLSISSVTVPAPFSITANTCTGANLAYNQTCVIDVKFRPTARISYSTNLTINSNDSSKPAATVALTGKGI
jgi:hypothetical protein